MEQRKVKIEEIATETAADVLKESLGMAKRTYKEASDREVAKILGLTEYQYNVLVNNLGRNFSAKLEEKMREIFQMGDALEVPGQFKVYVHESLTRKNEDGSKTRKLSINTFKAMKRDLN